MFICVTLTVIYRQLTHLLENLYERPVIGIYRFYKFSTLVFQEHQVDGHKAQTALTSGNRIQ